MTVAGWRIVSVAPDYTVFERATGEAALIVTCARTVPIQVSDVIRAAIARFAPHLHFGAVQDVDGGLRAVARSATERVTIGTASRGLVLLTYVLAEAPDTDCLDDCAPLLDARLANATSPFDLWVD